MKELIALCASVLNDSSVSVKHEHENENEHEHEHENENENEKELKNKENMKTHKEIRKEKKERRKKAKENKKKKVKENEKKDKKEEDRKTDKKKQISKRERDVLLRKMHARLHFGKTRLTLDALKDAYGIDFADACSLPCDACAWAKANISPYQKPAHAKQRE